MGSLCGGKSNMTVGEQARVFAAMIACGAVLGVLYDVMALLRRMMRAGPVLTGALDLLYGFCCGAGVVLFSLRMQAEAFRLYVLSGAALGLAVYFGTIGIFVRILDVRIRRYVKKSRKMEEKCQNDAGKWNSRANN